MTDEEKRKAIADRLRAAREMAGLSQGQVARMLGMHRPSISEMEAGRRRVSAEELAKLAEIYGVEPGWFANAQETDEAREVRVDLAARALANLNQQDLDRVTQLLQALRREGDDKK